MCTKDITIAPVLEALDTLLSAGVNINAVDAMGNTPLHIAVSRGCFNTMAALLQRGAGAWLVNAEDDTAADLMQLPRSKRMKR